MKPSRIRREELEREAMAIAEFNGTLGDIIGDGPAERPDAWPDGGCRHKRAIPCERCRNEIGPRAGDSAIPALADRGIGERPDELDPVMNPCELSNDYEPDEELC